MANTDTKPAAQVDPATGAVILRINGEEYSFDAPTLGQYRKMDEAMVARAAADDQRRAALAEGEPETFEDTWRTRLNDFAWWRLAYELCGDGKAFPDDDDLPIWLTSDLSAAAMIHWSRFPTEALGGPSLGQLTEMLTAAATNGAKG